MEASRRLAVIGDVHGELGLLRVVTEALAGERLDGILFVGDFASAEYEQHAAFQGHDADRLLQVVDATLAEVRGLGVPVGWVAGNHDIPEIDGPECCDRRLLEIGGVRIFGIGGAGPARFGFPYEWDEDEIERIEVPDCDVLLCHAPPFGTTLDLTHPGRSSAGSRAIRAIAEPFAGVLVCGHIHEAFGVEQVGECLCLNAGALGRPYGAPQVGFVELGSDGSRRVEHRGLASGVRADLVV